MFDALDLQTTDGEIAVINLERARRRSWNRFHADPLREGVAETVVEQEQLTAQFVSAVQALDRLEALGGATRPSRGGFGARCIDPGPSGFNGASLCGREALPRSSRQRRSPVS
jgi:hypothetical protein